ncbi:MAG: iron-containing alcohol dehydrogenase, partial [Melioribacteraceae bacterium]
VYNTVTNSLKENDIKYVECGGVKPNPILSKVYEAIEICKKENIDAILAVGGGSVIDSAKAIGAGAIYNGDIWDAFEGKTRLKKSLPIFTVLTISATGSEMNGYAVVTKEDEKKKWAFTAGVSSFPKVSIIDPSIQSTLPKEQTTHGAVDAMSHIFELYFDGSTNTDIMDEYSEGLLRTIIKHTKILLKDSQNYESRAQLVWAATLALNGTNGTGRNWGDWATHSMEHSISAYHDIAHGAGLAIMFPAWMNYVYKIMPEKFARLAEKVFEIKEGTIEEKAVAGIEAVKKFYREIGEPVSLNDINLSEKDIPTLADNASLQAPLGRLKKLERHDIENIFNIALI